MCSGNTIVILSLINYEHIQLDLQKQTIGLCENLVCKKLRIGTNHIGGTA